MTQKIQTFLQKVDANINSMNPEQIKQELYEYQKDTDAIKVGIAKRVTSIYELNKAFLKSIYLLNMEDKIVTNRIDTLNKCINADKKLKLLSQKKENDEDFIKHLDEIVQMKESFKKEIMKNHLRVTHIDVNKYDERISKFYSITNDLIDKRGH